jgi:hypothetical protein
MKTQIFIRGHDEPFASAIFVNIGYHRCLKHNLFLKASFSPWIVNENDKYGIIPWGRLAFGKTF